MGSGKHQHSFFSVILVLCCLSIYGSVYLWIYESISLANNILSPPPSHLGSLIKINRWFRPIFSLHAPHIGWRFSKVCHFFQLVCCLDLCVISVLFHNVLLPCLLFVILQFESPAGSAGGLCFLSSEVHWPAESLLFPANFRKSKVFFYVLLKKTSMSTKRQNAL